MVSSPLVRAALLATLVATVAAHAFMSYPATRGALSGSGGIFHYNPPDMSCPIDYCPECQNGAFLQNNHGSLMFAPYAPMDRTQPFRTGFGLCGDSGLDGRNPLTQPHMKAGAFSVGCEGTPSASGITPGQVLNIQIQSTAHHQGFLEFFLCDTSACGGDITPQCFEHEQCVQLLRYPHPSCESGEDMECAPIDPDFPGRWYMPCHKYPYLNENTSQMVQDQTLGGPNGKMAYQIPADFNCGKNCVLQSYWVTMNKCNPIGSAEYFEKLYQKGMLKSWNMCPGDGITLGGFSRLYSTCGSSLPLFPEEFWNCADIAMVGTPFNNHNYSQYHVPGNNGSGSKGNISKVAITTTSATSAATKAVSTAAVSDATASPSAASAANLAPRSFNVGQSAGTLTMSQVAGTNTVSQATGAYTVSQAAGTYTVSKAAGTYTVSQAAGTVAASAGSSSKSAPGSYIGNSDGNDAEADGDEDDCVNAGQLSTGQNTAQAPAYTTVSPSSSPKTTSGPLPTYYGTSASSATTANASQSPASYTVKAPAYTNTSPSANPATTSGSLPTYYGTSAPSATTANASQSPASHTVKAPASTTVLPIGSPATTSSSSPVYYGTSAPSATTAKASQSPASYHAPSPSPCATDHPHTP